MGLLCLASLLLQPVAQALAADPQSGAVAPIQKAKKPRTGTSGAKLVAPEGSGETAAARTARLKRECKGRPNAGACTGHTD
jgi:hypothetical protein